MQLPAYDHAQAWSLTPLLGAIGREVVERQDAIRELLLALCDGCEDRELAHELAQQRSALARAHEELEQLGCRLVGRRPLTFRIRRSGEGPRSFLWQGRELLAY